MRSSATGSSSSLGRERGDAFQPANGNLPIVPALPERETTDAVVVWIERRPLQTLALALGLGLVLGVAWRL